MVIIGFGEVGGSALAEAVHQNLNVVTNVSGYPKAMPHEASLLWSQASLKFILNLANNANLYGLKPL